MSCAARVSRTADSVMVDLVPTAYAATGRARDMQAGRALAIDRFEDRSAPHQVRDGDVGPRHRSHVDPAVLAMLTDPERRAAESRAYRALVERAYQEADGARAPKAPELAGVRSRHAEVFDRIEATQEPRDAGSVLPQSFNLSVGSGGKVWAAPNATKHIWEETRGLTFGRDPGQWTGADPVVFGVAEDQSLTAIAARWTPAERESVLGVR